MKARHMLLAATLLAGGVSAVAAQNAPIYDPNRLPALQGQVAQYSLTPRGDVDGLILDDGTEVHLPPHLGAQLVHAVKPGDAVTIRGLKAAAIPMVQAMSVSNNATGVTITDTGPARPPGPRTPRQAMTATGRVKAPLHGPGGELNGALLEDGTIVRLPPDEAARLAAMLATGSTVTVQGTGMQGPLGRVIAAQEIGADSVHLARVMRPPPPPPGGPGAVPQPPGRRGAVPPPPPPDGSDAPPPPPDSPMVPR